MDGKGYPSRLAGENIPVPVRAVTICDVYDALTSDRPYAKAITPFEALSIMREEMRDAFDMAMFKRLVMVLSGIDVV
jgi:HD-GYP domain-containing protein (c-di-GMP phosphodiesterase class II)